MIKESWRVYINVLKDQCLFLGLMTVMLFVGSWYVQLSILHCITGFIVACSLILGIYVLIFLMTIVIGIYVKRKEKY